MFDDSVQVRCRRCRSAFRERARRLQNGYSRQCPTCEVVLFFDEDSPDQATKRAMKNAKRVRAALREAEAQQPSKRRVVRGSGRRGSYEAAEANADENA